MLDLDDLARRAEAATPGYDWPVADEWAAQLDMTGLFPQHSEAQFAADGAWIAAANPATILRLIEDLRESQMERTDLLIERDALAARLAAHDEMAAQVGGVLAFLEVRPDIQTTRGAVASRLRAALAAPTDTTKEQA